MQTKTKRYTQRAFWGYIGVTLVTGVLTGALIFAFKTAASAVISLSGVVYTFVRTNPLWILPLIAAAVVLGLLSAAILRFAPNARGGGIPTAIAVLRGILSLRWLRNLLAVFSAALLSFLGGVPLGNEGPSVQMGTAVGGGTTRLLGRNHPAWKRYIMTGGACAGFAAATGAPLTGIFFALEEAHRRFSPLIFLSAATTVSAATVTMQGLGMAFEVSTDLFHFSATPMMPVEKLWAPLALGLICGVVAISFTKAYGLVGEGIQRFLKDIPFAVKMIAVFVLAALVGVILPDGIGSGHDLIESLVEGDGVWSILLLCFVVRAFLLMTANHIGVTGGLFVPTLAFGAILGGVGSNLLTATGALDAKWTGLMVMVGMVSFMSASSRTPVTAILFGVEALCGLDNIMPLILGATAAYLVTEAADVEGFCEEVVANKAAAVRKGKQALAVDAHMVLQSGAFAVGKEIRDILWPPTCVVVSVCHPTGAAGHSGLGVGDTLHLQYQTVDPDDTYRQLEDLLGVQDGHETMSAHREHTGREVPEI